MSDSRARTSTDPGAAAQRAALLTVGLAAALFACAALLPPLLETAAPDAAAALRTVYAPACHQLPDRCLRVGGQPAAVCARCLGLYCGGALALLACGVALRRGPRVRPWWLVAGVTPTIVDALAGAAGLPALPPVPRYFLGLFTGSVLGWFLAAGVADLAAMLWARRSAAPRRGPAVS